MIGTRQGRIAVTFLLPPRIAKAILDAARAGQRLVSARVVVQDHMIFARCDELLEQVSKRHSKRVSKSQRKRGEPRHKKGSTPRSKPP